MYQFIKNGDANFPYLINPLYEKLQEAKEYDFKKILDQFHKLYAQTNDRFIITQLQQIPKNNQQLEQQQAFIANFPLALLDKLTTKLQTQINSLSMFEKQEVAAKTAQLKALYQALITPYLL